MLTIDNFTPTRNKRTFAFLKDNVWKVEPNFPFNHFSFAQIRKEGGIFSSFNDLDLHVGDVFNWDDCNYEITLVETQNLFHREICNYTFYFNLKK